MEVEILDIKLKEFEIKKDFDYRGMKDKIKRAFTHMHRIEDVWIDLHIEEDIRRMNFSRLTLEQILNFDLTDILEEIEDDEEIVDSIYEQQKIAETPLSPICRS